MAGLVVLERGDRRGDAVVGEAGRDRHDRQPGQARGVLGDVERAAAADADHRVVEPGAQPRGQRRRRPAREPPSTSQISPFASCGRSVAAISSPSPGPTTTATCPPLEIRRSASSGARPATAPGPMSIVSGVPTMRVSSGTRPPAPARGRGGRRPRPTRRCRSARCRRGRRGRRAPGSRPRSRACGSRRQVASSASASGSAAAGSISVTPMYSPCAVAGSSALLMRSR